MVTAIALICGKRLRTKEMNVNMLKRVIDDFKLSLSDGIRGVQIEIHTKHGTQCKVCKKDYGDARSL